MIPWPNQGRPPDCCWVIWRRFLNTCFAPVTQKLHRLTQPIKLHQPLGKWKTKTPYTAQEYYYSSSRNAVFKSYQELPSDAEICAVRKFGSTIYCKAPLSHAVTLHDSLMATNAGTQTFAAFLVKQPHHVQQLLGNLCAEDVDVDYWINAINVGAVTIATDGSVADKKGYFVAVLYTTERFLRYQGPCDRAKDLMTSYWKELSGILFTLYLIRAFTEFSNTVITSAPPLFCNNSAAVSRTKKTISPGICEHLVADYN
eukprot:15338972-Ditylum_brightwellii.AAC.1